MMNLALVAQRRALPQRVCRSFFFYTYTPTTEIYTLSLHDALPIFSTTLRQNHQRAVVSGGRLDLHEAGLDRKSTRLHCRHVKTSYAVFCLQKKKGSRLTATKPPWPAVNERESPPWYWSARATTGQRSRWSPWGRLDPDDRDVVDQ